MPAPTDTTYVTIAEAMASLKCSRRTIVRMLDRGELTRHRVGERLVRIDAQELHDLVRGDVA